MALRFCDSFKHYATADLTTKWSYVWSSVAITAGAGRFGGAALSIANVAYRIYVDLGTASATWIVGFAFQTSNPAQTAQWVVSFWDGTTEHVRISCTGDSYLQAGRAATSLGVGSWPLVASRWYWVEVKVTIDDTNGGVWIKINGDDYLRLGAYAASPTSLDTRNGGNASANRVQLGTGSGSAAVSAIYEDLYILDSTSPNNDFLGDVKVECLLPTGSGETTDWTPNTGANYAAVDEAAPDGDTTYISSSTANQIDTYALGNLATTDGTVYGVQYLLLARKDDAGSRSIAPVVRPADTDRVQATATLGDSYAYVRQTADVNPEDSAAWEIADVNEMQYGVKLIT